MWGFNLALLQQNILWVWGNKSAWHLQWPQTWALVPAWMLADAATGGSQVWIREYSFIYSQAQFSVWMSLWIWNSFQSRNKKDHR